MRRLFPLVAIALAGCTGEEAKEAVRTVPEAGIELAGKAVRTDGIAMSWEGNSVHVGDAWEAAQRLFPERRGAYRLRSLPERFGRDFEAHGWETNEGQGFGVILHDDLVVAAIYHAERVEPEEAQRLFEAQRAGTGALPMSEVRNGSLLWNLWEDGSQRLMVLRDIGKRGTDVTLLMGDDKVLDALGATKPASSSKVPALDLSVVP